MDDYLPSIASLEGELNKFLNPLVKELSESTIETSDIID